MSSILAGMPQRESEKHAQINKATIAEATILAAEPNNFLDISTIVVNGTGGANTVTFKDSTAGTTQLVMSVANLAAVVANFFPPLNQTAINNNWTVTLLNATAVDITIQAVKRS